MDLNTVLEAVCGGVSTNIVGFLFINVLWRFSLLKNSIIPYEYRLDRLEQLALLTQHLGLGVTYIKNYLARMYKAEIVILLKG